LVDLGTPRNAAPDLPIEVATLEELRGLAEEFSTRIDAVQTAERIM